MLLLLLLLRGRILLGLLLLLLLLSQGLLLGWREVGLDADFVELGDSASRVLESVPGGLENLLARVGTSLVRMT